ncbi:MAG: hypothetical protein ACPF8V_03040 [Luteibaculum sp.]
MKGTLFIISIILCSMAYGQKHRAGLYTKAGLSTSNELNASGLFNNPFLSYGIGLQHEYELSTKLSLSSSIDFARIGYNYDRLLPLSFGSPNSNARLVSGEEWTLAGISIGTKYWIRDMYFGAQGSYSRILRSEAPLYFSANRKANESFDSSFLHANYLIGVTIELGYNFYDTDTSCGRISLFAYQNITDLRAEEFSTNSTKRLLWIGVKASYSLKL